MYLTFLRTVDTVTGSKYLLTYNNQQILEVIHHWSQPTPHPA